MRNVVENMIYFSLNGVSGATSLTWSTDTCLKLDEKKLTNEINSVKA